MTIFERIKKLRLEKGWTLEELGQAAGLSKQTMWKYESGSRPNIKADKIARIAVALGVSPVYLMFGDEYPNTNGLATPDQHITDRPAPSGTKRIPVLGTIPAGIPLEAIEEIIDWEEIPTEWTRGGKEYFALQVHGLSMYPRYEDGDVLILRKQDTCESGQDCAVIVNGNDATFKRVKLTEDGIMLQAINPDCESYFYTNQQVCDLPVRILGVVVELRRKI